MSDPKKNIEPAIEPDVDEDDAEQALPESEESIEAADGPSLADYLGLHSPILPLRKWPPSIWSGCARRNLMGLTFSLVCAQEG